MLRNVNKEQIDMQINTETERDTKMYKLAERCTDRLFKLREINRQKDRQTFRLRDKQINEQTQEEAEINR